MNAAPRVTRPAGGKQLILTRPIFPWSEGEEIAIQLVDLDRNELIEAVCVVRIVNPPSAEEFCRQRCGICESCDFACPLLKKAGYADRDR